MHVSNIEHLARLDAILYQRPAGRNIIGFAIDEIKSLRSRLAHYENNRGYCCHIGHVNLVERLAAVEEASDRYVKMTDAQLIDLQERDERREERLAAAEGLLREAAAILRADTDQRRRDNYSYVIDCHLAGAGKAT